MAYDAKKIYYRFDDHLSRLVLDYEASRQISSESESLYHGLPTDPYDEGLFEEHNVKRGLRNADGSGVVAARAGRSATVQCSSLYLSGAKKARSLRRYMPAT